MRTTSLIILSIIVSLQTCIPQRLQNQNQNQNNFPANRQGGLGGLSFAIPGLSLLGGNNAGGGNLFGTVTVTRTLVSTVSTVTTASFRTCVSFAMNLMPCAPMGRRKREVETALENVKIEATPSVELIIGSTTLQDPGVVTEYLEQHKPSSQSVIFPPEVDNAPVKINPRFQSIEDTTTMLYPSQDIPETTEVDLNEISGDDIVTTGTPEFFDDFVDNDESEGTTVSNDVLSEDDKARVGLGRTTTVTTVIRVTSVATSLATGGMMATVTVVYSGCSPVSLPYSGPSCN